MFLLTVHGKPWKKILNIKWQDHISNKSVKEKSKLPELLITVMKQKWKWAGHVARMNGKWAHDLTMWNPDQAKGNRGRPKNARLKRSANISAKHKNGLKWQEIVLSGSTWRRPSSCSVL